LTPARTRSNTADWFNVTATATVRVRLRYSDLETFIERFAPNVTRGGIFLASRQPRAEGEIFRFEVQLATGAVALAGEGKVIWVKAFDPNEPQKPHGMGVQFVQIDPGSRDTLTRILQAKSNPRAPAAPAAAAAPRATGPRPTLQRAGAAATGTNGHSPRVDTNVDLAAEYGIDEVSLRRVIDRNWTLGPRASDEDIEALLKPEAAETATLAQALAEMPRLLDPAPRHRSGPTRTLESAPVASGAPAAAPVPLAASASSPAVVNGEAHETPSSDGERKVFD
jgi:uncharacterized protein (TIGR02266 family)